MNTFTNQVILRGPAPLADVTLRGPVPPDISDSDLVSLFMFLFDYLAEDLSMFVLQGPLIIFIFIFCDYYVY